MNSDHLKRLSVLVLLWALAVLPASARAQSASTLDGEEQRLLQNIRAGHAGNQKDSRGIARKQLYENPDKTGGLHTIGNVWMHMDNTNYSPGNIWYVLGLNQDPAAQWPGNSNIEYILYSLLSIAGKDKDGVRRNDEFDEIRGELPDFAITRHAYEGILGGRREFDDDGDRKLDEDFLNGKDDDADGRVDEDFAAISPDMFSTEMLDYTPEAIGDASLPEVHVALGVRVQRTSYAWSTPGGNDFVGWHYDITNMTRAIDGQGRSIDSMYVGMFWRPSTGPRDNPNANSDDLPGAMEVAADGKTPPEALLADDKRPERAAHEDSIMHIFYSADNDGDEGRTKGAAAMMFLGATKFPRLGFKANLSADDIAADEYGNAPRHMSVHSFRQFRSGLPYAQGGRPTTDLEYYDAMSNKSKSTTEFPDPDNTGIYRILESVGPYVTLPIDSTISLDMAWVVGKADYDVKKNFPGNFTEFRQFNDKFGIGAGEGNLLASCQEAWRAWRGNYVADPAPRSNGFSCFFPNDPRNPGGTIGRESCLLTAPGKTGQYHDCRDQEGDQRELNDLRCTWFDLDCDNTTGICEGGKGDGTGTPAVYHRGWVGSAPPVPPRVKIRPLDHGVEVSWDDIAEKVADPGTHVLDFKGYRLYRAVGWKRDSHTGVNGPANDLWELIGDWAGSRPGSPAAAGSLEEVRDSVRYPADSTFSFDTTQTCDLGSSGSPDTPCHVHKIGYYKFVDRNVINGFRYFYVVTAYDQNEKAIGSQNTPLDKFESQETGRSSTEDKVVVTRTECSPDLTHIKVVPNPYRFHAAWDLQGSSADPTGTHVDFNHLPCGAYTLRIFTLAGDLVQTFHESSARNGGGTIEWNLVSRNGQDIKAGIYVYSVESAKYGKTVGRFTVIR